MNDFKRAVVVATGLLIGGCANTSDRELEAMDAIDVSGMWSGTLQGIDFDCSGIAGFRIFQRGARLYGRATQDATGLHCNNEPADFTGRVDGNDVTIFVENVRIELKLDPTNATMTGGAARRGTRGTYELTKIP